MCALGTLLNRRQPKASSLAAALSAMAHFALRLRDEMETATTGQAGLIIRPADPPSAEGVIVEVEQVIAGQELASGTANHVEADQEGYAWLIIESPQLKQLTKALWRAGEAFSARGLEDRLLAAVFPFTWKDRRLYWICPAKTGRYAPFVPADAHEHLRDYPLEERMVEALHGHIPIERDRSQWYPLWGIPI
jgi:hypothetical protein